MNKYRGKILLIQSVSMEFDQSHLICTFKYRYQQFNGHRQICLDRSCALTSGGSMVEMMALLVTVANTQTSPAILNDRYYYILIKNGPNYFFGK